MKEREYNDLKPDAEEFRIFKQTKIWKGLTMYRKVKKYTKNFIINIFKDGPIVTFKRIFQRIKRIIEYRKQRAIDKDRYQYWLKTNKITPLKRMEIKKEIEDLEYKPLISIIMPVYNVDIKWLKEAVRSVENQIYTNWELCIADDASTKPRLIKYLKQLEKKEKIKVIFRENNGHISKASNSALKLATGEFVALMDNDDIIHPHALAEVMKVLNEKRDPDLIYSDEDKLDMRGKRVEPFFKPDWSPDFFLSANYLSHLTVLRKTVIEKVNGFRKGYEGSQDYDLLLRVTDFTDKIEHIPDILYSWRKVPGSTATNYDQKGYASKTSIKALEDTIERRNLDATVENGALPGFFRIKYKIKGNPLVSILIPTLDKYEYIERCISSLFETTTYDNYEVIIIDTGTTDEKTLEYYDSLKSNPKIKFLYWDKKFNYSSVNNYGVENAKGEYILLLNNDTEVISPDWIESMLEHAQRKETGAVGAKLYYPNDTIQHAGVILGTHGGAEIGAAGHAFQGLSSAPHDSSLGQKDIIRNYSAVTAACLMVNKEKYLKVGGLDPRYRIAFNDVDFCLKLRAKGYYNIYNPYVELYHHESVSVGTPEKGTRNMKEFVNEVYMLNKKWRNWISNDPFYNKNLSLVNGLFQVKVDR
jgi:O-antigen biosynthesis protein